MASPFQGTHHRQMPCLSVSMAGSNYWADFPDRKCVRSTASVGPYKGTFKPMVFGQIQIAADIGRSLSSRSDVKASHVSATGGQTLEASSDAAFASRKSPCPSQLHLPSL